MGTTLDLARTALRAYKTDGVPATLPNPPSKTDLLAALADADARLGAVEASAGVSIVKSSWAALIGITGTVSGERAEVFDDSGTHSDPVLTSSHTVTISIATPGVLTWSGHGLPDGAICTLSTTGALPTGLSAATPYFIVGKTANTFELATTQNGAPINTSGTQSGTHTATITVPNTGVFEWSPSPAGWKFDAPDAVSSKAPINSPALTGTPTSPTPSPGDNSTKIATTAFAVALAATTEAKVDAALAGLLPLTDLWVCDDKDVFATEIDANGGVVRGFDPATGLPVGALDFPPWSASGGKYSLTARPAVQLTPYHWHGYHVFGQSLGTGSTSLPVLTTARLFNNLMFSGGTRPLLAGTSGYNYLVEDNTSAVDGGGGTEGETTCSGCANYAVQLAARDNAIDPANFIIFASCAAHGGTSIAELMKEEPGARYDTLTMHFTQAKALADVGGVGYDVAAVGWIQGEGDSPAQMTKILAADVNIGDPTITLTDATGVYVVAEVLEAGNQGLFAPNTYVTNIVGNVISLSRATIGTRASGNGVLFALTGDQYEDRLKQMADDIAEDACAITGQPTPPHLLTYQTATNHDVALAQWRASRTHPLIHIVHNTAFLDHNVDGLHITNLSELFLGARFGRAYKQLVVDGKVPDNIDIISAFALGTALTVKFRVPTAPLVLDTTNLGPTTDMGFAVHDSSGTLTLSSIAVTGGDTITMTLNRVLANSPVFRVGLDHSPSSGYPLNFSSGPGHNLRDSTTDTFAHLDTATITIASPGVVTWANSYPPPMGSAVVFSTTGALPTGLTAGTTYYVVGRTTGGCTLGTSPGGSPINTSGTQSGTHTMVATVSLWHVAPLMEMPIMALLGNF